MSWPYISGQSGKTSEAAVRGDVRPEEHQGVHGRRRERDDERQALAAAVRGQLGRVARADEDEDRGRQDEHRDGQVRGHRFARVAGLDRPLAQPGLEAREHDGHQRDDHDRPRPPLRPPGSHDEAEHEEADEDAPPAMDRLDPGLVVADRRG